MISKKGKVIITLGTSIVAALVLFLVASYGESVLDKDENQARAISDLGCPIAGDWVGLSDFCIMDDEFGGTDTWEAAPEECFDSAQGSRLCTSTEWMSACLLDSAGSISLDGMANDDDEWIGDMISTTEAVTVGAGNCGEFSSAQVVGVDDREWRCCINKEY